MVAKRSPALEKDGNGASGTQFYQIWRYTLLFLVVFLSLDLLHNTWLMLRQLTSDGLWPYFIKGLSVSALCHRVLTGLPALLCAAGIYLNGWCLGSLLYARYFSESPFTSFYTWVLGTLTYAVGIFILGSGLRVDTWYFCLLCCSPLFIRVACLHRKPIQMSAILPMARIREWPWGLLLVGLSFVPLCLLAQTPPLDYDVLEYHLGAPKEYVTSGQITFLPHNLYANMPSVSSMLNMVMILFKQGEGVKNLQVWALFLTALGLAMVIPGRRGWIIAACFLACPAWILAASAARNEPMIAWVTLGCFIPLIENPRRTPPLFLGLMLGGLFALKYAACVVVLPPLVLVFLLQRRLREFSFLVLGALLVAAPWLIRNGLQCGDPFFPFGQLTFPEWLPGRVAVSESFAGRHFASSFQWSVLRDTLTEMFLGWDGLVLGFQGLTLVAWPGLWQKNRRLYLSLVLMITGMTLVWLLFTHRVTRFAFLLLPLEMLLVGWLWHDLPRRWSRVLPLAMGCQLVYSVILFCFFCTQNTSTYYLTGQLDKDAYIVANNSKYALVLNQQADLMDFQHLLYVSEARIFYRDWEVTYSTPYLSPAWLPYFQEGGLNTVQLMEDGIDGVFFNRPEYERVQDKTPEKLPWQAQEIELILKRDARLVWESPKGMSQLYQVVKKDSGLRIQKGLRQNSKKNL